MPELVLRRLLDFGALPFILYRTCKSLQRAMAAIGLGRHLPSLASRAAGNAKVLGYLLSEARYLPPRRVLEKKETVDILRRDDPAAIQNLRGAGFSFEWLNRFTCVICSAPRCLRLLCDSHALDYPKGLQVCVDGDLRTVVPENEYATLCALAARVPDRRDSPDPALRSLGCLRLVARVEIPLSAFEAGAAAGLGRFRALLDFAGLSAPPAVLSLSPALPGILARAAKHGHLDLLQYLLDLRPALPPVPPQQRERIFCAACEGGSLPCLEFLEGRLPHSPAPRSREPLFLAALASRSVACLRHVAAGLRRAGVSLELEAWLAPEDVLGTSASLSRVVDAVFASGSLEVARYFCEELRLPAVRPVEFSIWRVENPRLLEYAFEQSPLSYGDMVRLIWERGLRVDREVFRAALRERCARAPDPRICCFCLRANIHPDVVFEIGCPCSSTSLREAFKARSVALFRTALSRGRRLSKALLAAIVQQDASEFLRAALERGYRLPPDFGTDAAGAGAYRCLRCAEERGFDVPRGAAGTTAT
jgi:hypothetical protein